MKEVRIGLVGLSARGLCWIDSLKRVKDCKITALCERYEPLLEKAAEFAGDPDIKPYTSYEKMLAEAPIDAVGVCVAPDDQPDLICQALEAGKHVACEVPLCYSLEGCWKVVVAAEKNPGLKFMMAEQIRYLGVMQAWRKMVQDGTLGKILFCEGQYFHGMGRDRFYVDGRTGKRITLEEAKDNPHAVKSRYWRKTHAIYYLPHELSPLLNILDDRVKTVVAMSTRPESYYYEGIPFSDIEVALMRTEKDVILRLAAGFHVPSLKVEPAGYHWYHIMGTRGRVETNRSKSDGMKMWLPEQHMDDMAIVHWDYLPYQLPPGAMGSGHHNADYFPMANFVRCVLDDTASPMDAYRAAEVTAPALMAGMSIDKGSVPLEVPDFRPGAGRKTGHLP